MRALVLFDGARCLTFSPNAVAAELPLPSSRLSKFKQGASVFTLLPQNEFFSVSGGVRLLAIDAEERFFSTMGVSPIRVGSGGHDHISIGDSDAEITIDGNRLNILAGTDLYINGKKAEEAEYSLSLGDTLWLGAACLVIHEGYIACAGPRVVSRLNLSLHTPEPYENFPNYSRSPRIIKREPTDSVELTPPVPKEEKKKVELPKPILPPLMTAALTVGMGILMGRGIFVLMSAGAMLIAV
ncbi:MAG: hypothetical protein FWC62_00550, partial [Firmicutes bacterium]|nr:hypothetical protein [Bacillota bacterium]